MTRVIIHRPLWFRGKTGTHSALKGRQHQEGHEKMCCLGFACLTLGVPEEEIKGKLLPSSVSEELPGLTVQHQDSYLQEPYFTNTDFSSKAAGINDDDTITDEERESKLTELAAANGFEFVFVG